VVTARLHHPPAMLSLRLVAGALAVGVGLATVACAQNVDPAPPHFLLGASKGDNGTVNVRVVECYGGTLKAFDIERVGSNNVRSPLWRIEAENAGGVTFARGQEQTITVGSTPTGMREVLPLAASLPQAEKLSVGVNFTTQPSASYGFSFRVDDIEPGKTWIALGNGKSLSNEEFSSEVGEVCKSST